MMMVMMMALSSARCGRLEDALQSQSHQLLILSCGKDSRKRAEQFGEELNCAVRRRQVAVSCSRRGGGGEEGRGGGGRRKGERGRCRRLCGLDALAVTPRINQLCSNRNDAPACGRGGRRLPVGWCSVFRT